jgi:hypothetical protein
MGEKHVRGWHARIMRIACETRSVCTKETSIDNAKRTIFRSDAERDV